MKQNWKIITAFTFVIIIIPTLIYYFFAKQATIGEWLGFFGSYIGSAISIVFAYINTKIQLGKTKEKEVIDDLEKLLRSAQIISRYFDSLKTTMLDDKTMDQATSQQFAQKIFNVEIQINKFGMDYAALINKLNKKEYENIDQKFNTWFDDCYIILSIMHTTPSGLLDKALLKKNNWIEKISKLQKSTDELEQSIAAVCDQRETIYQK